MLGKFPLANHARDNPIIQISAWIKIKNKQLVAPMIGKAINHKDLYGFMEWWDKIN